MSPGLAIRSVTDRFESKRQPPGRAGPRSIKHKVHGGHHGPSECCYKLQVSYRVFIPTHARMLTENMVSDGIGHSKEYLSKLINGLYNAYGYTLQNNGSYCLFDITPKSG